MLKGFFKVKQKQPSTKRVSLLPGCGACGLYKQCESPKMEPTGRGERGVLIVAEAPGKTEDEQGVQLVGQAGKFLRKRLDQIDIDLDRDCWKTNALTCRPPKNRKPTSAEIEHCRPNLLAAIKQLKPRVIVPMGDAACRSVLGHLWQEDIGRLERWVGFQIPNQRPNVWICPTWHPSHVMRQEKDQEGPVLDLWFRRHLQAAFELEGRPWPECQDWERDVEIVSSEVAADKLCELCDLDVGAVAFDYETSTLKPDCPGAEIVTASVCWGRERPEQCFAYPFRGAAVEATGRFLRSRMPKVAANMKFEDRWTRKQFGHRVRNWVHDTMLFGHFMDNRQGICSLSFQAFVHLGLPRYDLHIKPFLKSPGSRTVNKIGELDKRELLLYNGLDSAVEFRLAVRQLRMIGWKLPWRTG